MSGSWVVAYVVLWVAVLLCTTVLIGVLRRVSVTLERAEELLSSAASGMVLEGLPPRSPLPTFEATTAEGDPFADADVRGSPAIFLFLDPGCGPCEALARELRASDDVPVATIYVVLERSAEPTFDLGPAPRVLYQENRAVSRAFRSSVTPNAIAIDSRGVVVARSIPNSLEELTELSVMASRSDGQGGSVTRPSEFVG